MKLNRQGGRRAQTGALYGGGQEKADCVGERDHGEDGTRRVKRRFVHGGLLACYGSRVLPFSPPCVAAVFRRAQARYALASPGTLR